MKRGLERIRESVAAWPESEARLRRDWEEFLKKERYEVSLELLELMAKLWPEGLGIVLAAQSAEMQVIVDGKTDKSDWNGEEGVRLEFVIANAYLYGVREGFALAVEPETDRSMRTARLRNMVENLWCDGLGESLANLWSRWTVDNPEVAAVAATWMVASFEDENLLQSDKLVINAALIRNILSESRFPLEIKQRIRGILMGKNLVDNLWPFGLREGVAGEDILKLCIQRFAGIVACLGNELGMDGMMKLGFDPFAIAGRYVSGDTPRDEGWYRFAVGNRAISKMGVGYFGEKEELSFPKFVMPFLDLSGRYGDFLVRMGQVASSVNPLTSPFELSRMAALQARLATSLRSARFAQVKDGAPGGSWRMALAGNIWRAGMWMEEQNARTYLDLIDRRFEVLLSYKLQNFEDWVAYMDEVLRVGIGGEVKSEWKPETRQALAGQVKVWWDAVYQLHGLDLSEPSTGVMGIRKLVALGLVLTGGLVNERHEAIVSVVKQWEGLMARAFDKGVGAGLRRVTAMGKADRGDLIGRELWGVVMGEETFGVGKLPRWREAVLKMSNNLLPRTSTGEDPEYLGYWF